MTQVVVEAERRDELPPTRLSPRQFLHPDVPTLLELKAVRGLYQISYSILCCIDTHVRFLPKDRHGSIEFEARDRLPEWMARLDQTAYRLLILGAALAGAYQEPLFKAREHPDPALKGLRKRFENHQSSTFLRDDVAFLAQFTVCDLEASPDAQHALFGPTAEWLLDNILSDKESRAAMSKRFEQRRGRASYCLSRDNCPMTVLADGRGTHSDAHLVLLELMRMLWLFHHARNMVDFRHPFKGNDDDPEIEFPLSSAVAVFPGIFRACEVKLPYVVGSHKKCLVFDAYPAVPRRGEKSPSDEATSVLDFSSSVFNHSGRANYVHETLPNPAPSLDVKFFEYFLRHYLGVCFPWYFFNEGSQKLEMPSYAAFAACAGIFAHDDVENRSFYEQDEWVLQCADFLDGSEMVDKFPLGEKTFYQPPQ